jgi:hypothetical protein
MACVGVWVREETKDEQKGRATHNITIIQADMIHILPSQMHCSNFDIAGSKNEANHNN